MRLYYTVLACRLHLIALMSAVKSTVWGTIIALALILVAIFMYGTCSSRP
jgi:hypothetical protein